MKYEREKKEAAHTYNGILLLGYARRTILAFLLACSSRDP